MRAADNTRPGCPVCGLAARPDAYCECGWELQAPRRLGPVTAAMQADFDRRLGAARLEFDARAAAVIAPDPGRFARWIRGGVPDRAQWAAAQRQASAAAAGAMDEDSARKELAAVLRELDARGQALVLEIGPEGIGATRVAIGAGGAPVFGASQPERAWSELLPGLSAHPDERLLQLAGGGGGLGGAPLRKCLDEVIQAAYGDEVLVICRPAGWALLEAAAIQVALMFPGARLLRVTAESAAGDLGTVGTLTASMPLLRGYGLVVATVDPVTGAVAPSTRPLFPPGAVPGSCASVTLRRFPGDQGRATLAVAVDAAWSAEPHVVAVHTVPQPRPLYRVSAVLDASGQVRFTEPHDITEESRSWSDVWAGVPGQVDVRPAEVDLVCAVELAGEPARVAKRKELVSGLLEELAREYPDGAAPRVSVIGCLDHVYAPGEEQRRVVRGVPLGPLDDAIDALADLRGDEVRYPDAAPLEDLLYDAHRILADSRAGGRVGRLLLVAGRRPHPPSLTVHHVPGTRIVQPCPLRRDWRASLRQLDRAGVSTVAVADVSPGRSARAGFWAEAVKAGPRTLPSATARSIGEDLGLLIRHEQRTGLPLPA